MRNPGQRGPFIVALVIALCLAAGNVIAQGTPNNEPIKVDESAAVLRLLRETHSELRQALDLLAAQLKSNKPRPWKDAPVIASVVASLLIATGGWWLAFYQMKQAQRAAKAARLEQHLFDSLDWFSGKTQRRSIGIAVVRANWDAYDALRPTWLSMLVSQAIYLLKESESHHKSHEHANLYAIMDLVRKGRATLQASDRDELLAAVIENRENQKSPDKSKHGLKDIDESHYTTWEGELGDKPHSQQTEHLPTSATLT